MTIVKYFYASVFFVLSITYGTAQVHECTLDIGGKSSELVTSIFQLNESQKLQMEELRAEYSKTSKALEDEIKKLFSEHPQSTTDELTVLAEKYKVLQEKIVLESRAIDEKLLASFNQRQYDRYLSLCYEAFRKPIEITPKVYDDQIDHE